MQQIILRHAVRTMRLCLIVILLLCGMTAAIAQAPVTGTENLVRLSLLKSINEQSGQIFVSFALAPSGNMLALGGDDGIVRLWDLQTDSIVQTLDVDTQAHFINCVVFSPDGKQLACHADEGAVEVWDLEQEAKIAHSPEKFSWVEHLSFSPDGRSVGSICESIAQVWNVQSGETWSSDQTVSSLAFSPDGKIVALGSDTLRFVDAATGRNIREVGKIEGQVTGMSFAPSGNEILVVDGACRGTTVRLVNTDSGNEKVLGPKLAHEKAGVSYLPNGKAVVVGDYAGNAIVWNIDTGLMIGSFAGLPPWTDTLALIPKAGRLLAGKNGNEI